MSIHTCPSCKLPLTDAEWTGDSCPVCGQALRALAAPAAIASLSAAAAAPAAGPTPAPAAPISQAFHGPTPWLITWSVLGLGFLVLACLAWVRPAPVPQGGAAQAELERLEQRLQKLDNLAHALSLSKTSDAKAVHARLDQLEAKLTSALEGIARAPGPAAAPSAAEWKAQSELLAKLETKLEALAQRSFAPPPPPGPLQIRVISKEWGDAEPDNVEAVCRSTASELWQYFPDRRLEQITVNYSTKGPMVVFGRGPDGERRVLLDIKGRLWARCAYQFGHEFCHILCNYRDVKSPNHWFEEALCETASLFALRRMAETWMTKPPYGNWKSYAVHLSEYADIMAREVPALDKLTLAEWFAKNEDTLRKDPTLRPRNRLVSLSLLKLFERSPHHWQAVGYLNQWDPKDAQQPFAAYLRDWGQRVPAVHQPFIQEIATLLGVKL